MARSVWERLTKALGKFLENAVPKTTPDNITPVA
jgi:hypothetical protein